jgi:hypothetical protein
MEFLEMINIIISFNFESSKKIFVADFADFVADFVAEKIKPLDYQGVLRTLGRCGRGSNPRPPA